MKCNWVIFLPHTHTHGIAISFGFEKTIMKFNKLGMSSARLENVLVVLLRDCLQEMFIILALLTIVNQFRELSQSILEFDFINVLSHDLLLY